MKPRFLTLTFICAAVFLQTHAQQEITRFREAKIIEGNTYNIDGMECSEPDVYLQKLPDNTYMAVRLSVVPTPNESKEITQPYVYASTPTSVSLGWKTSRNVKNPLVKYGLNADKLDLTAVGSNVRLAGTYYWNSVAVDRLKPNTTYYYQIISDERTSDVFSFRTMPEYGDAGKIRVLFIGDHQRNDRSDYEWLLKAAERKASEKYGEAPLHENVHFIMNVGDQVDAGLTELYEDVHLFKSRFFSPYLSTMTTVGNHEYKEDPNLKLYNAHYAAYSQMDYKGIKSNTANYYAYQVGTVLFVSINSDEPTAEQKMWIRKVIAAAAVDETVDFIVSVQHRPLYAEQYAGDVSPWMLNEIMPVLSSTPKHVLNCGGHHHLYARGQMTDTPVYHIISGGGVGTSAEGYEQLWGATPDNRNHDEVQKTIDHWTYQLFEFDPVTKEMTVETYSIGNSRLALDNVLVDKFTRNLGSEHRPARPKIVRPSHAVELPYVIKQESQQVDLHSVQYQISNNGDFTDIVIDKVMNFEDMYGVDDKKMPLDINKGIDITEYTVQTDDIYNGTYYVRVRNRNMNLDWSEFSEPVQIVVEGASDPVSVTVNGNFFRTGQPIDINYTGAPVGQNAWVAVYEDGKRPGTSDLSYKYEYTNASSGKWSFSIDEPNVYYAVLFKDGGYTEISERISFVVSDNADDSHKPVIQTDKNVYAVGEPVVAHFANATCLEKDWIGIYEQSIVPVNAKCPTYEYVGKLSDGSVTLNVAGTHNYVSPLTQGVYYVGYFNKDGYHESAQRCHFVIGCPVKLETDKTDYTPSDNVNLVYEGMPPFKGNEVVVYGNNGRILNKVCHDTGGSVCLGELPVGEYEVCAVTAEGHEISSRVKFRVTTVTCIENTNAVVDKVCLEDNTLFVSSTFGIDKVNVFLPDGTAVFNCSANGATSVGVPFSFGRGVYFVSVDGRKTRKVLKTK